MNRTKMLLWQLACIVFAMPALGCQLTNQDSREPASVYPNTRVTIDVSAAVLFLHIPDAHGYNLEDSCVRKLSEKKYQTMSITITTMEKFVIAKLFIRPEFTDEFNKALEELAVLTRKEPGCIEYTYYPEPAEKGAFTLIEHYQDQPGVHYHFQQAYLAAFVKKLEGWKSKDLKVYFLSVEPEALKDDK
ncbi:putative quinol monooxygenase [Chitinophaga flava]|uniref:ABM domain-containing protein n=1 Tax=Chitinophaga flava TaxID=2259036 RepID=A0A365XYL5_9BACT|nr:putative quinol monooxygenase [Chitinophaga flava]RBL91158.1 hypothetical protein DF182_00610 [Chitinophaga flava]